MKRNEECQLRKPENTSYARARAFNKVKVGGFFEKLKSFMEKYHFGPERIFNLDETGVTTVPKAVKVVAKKGKKQVGSAATAERGELTTIVGIISASGCMVPPVYIFPRLRHVEEFIVGGPPGALGTSGKS